MQILAIILGIVTTLLAVFSICFVIKNYFRRKVKAKNMFEVYKENELAYTAMIFLNVAFAVLLIVGGVISKADDPVPGSMIIFIFIVCVLLSYITMRLSKRSLAVRNETISVFSKLLFPEKTFHFTDINRAYINNNYMFLYDEKNICIAKAHTVCANYGVFLQLLIHNNINIIFQKPDAYSGISSQKIIIKMSALSKFFSLAGALAVVIGLSFLAFADFAELAARVIFISLAALSFLILIWLCLVAFRRKVEVEDNDIIYTPFLGKERKYSCKNIDYIDKNYTEMRGHKHHYISIYFKNEKAIRNIPYRFLGVQEFLYLMRHKVKETS